MLERHHTMKRILTLATLLATLAGSALAAQPAERNTGYSKRSPGCGSSMR